VILCVLAVVNGKSTVMAEHGRIQNDEIKKKINGKSIRPNVFAD